MKNIKILIAFMVVSVFSLALASTASAECGPGFSNKKQLIHYYQHNPSAAHGFRKELLAHPDTGYQADETVVNWLKSPEQKVFNAPSGYVLNSNTYCPGGAGQYQPYGGLLGNMAGKPMLWHCPKGECIPVLKGYCMNFVCGPAVHKHPKHHPKKPHKCGCRPPKKKHHKKPSCQAIGKVTGPAGSCVNQTVTVTPKQECEANNHSTTGCQQTTITVVANCSDVAVGTSGPVGQGGNCNTGGEQTCVGQGNCVVETPPPPPPPCPCRPEEPEKPKTPEPPVVKWETLQEIWLGHSRPICVAVTPPSGVSVHIDAEQGEVKNGGNAALLSGTNKYCVSYVAPTEEPPHVCVEPISNELPPGTKCDIVEAVVVSSNGAKTVTAKKEIPNIQEGQSVTWE